MVINNIVLLKTGCLSNYSLQKFPFELIIKYECAEVYTFIGRQTDKGISVPFYIVFHRTSTPGKGIRSCRGIAEITVLKRRQAHH